jgi:EAL domain-containing protein (putative c-di-GMP-specific phosphodiesterase class I)/CheY-like chemotaxis protein
VRILVADDDETIRDALAALIRTDPLLELAATAGDARQAVDAADRTQPDVALVDVRMPGGGVAAVQGIRVRSADTRIVALSAWGGADSVFDMLRAGAAGFLVKSTLPAAILEAIHRVAAGEAPLSPEVAEGVVRGLADRLQADSDHRETWMRRMALIDRALHGDALTTVFQPIVDLQTGRVLGVEALSRFDLEPARSPDQWFAEAAALGRGTELEVAAVRCAGRWRDRLPAGSFLSVNTSPATLLSVDGQTALGDLTAGGLVVEVTEHAPVADYAALRACLDPLRPLGVRLAVDDVGAGYASMRHIIQLSPQILKLDITLTHGIDHDPALRALSEALISFAHTIGAEIIAEGVETEAERHVLVDLGVGAGQGYLLGRPAPIA